MQSGRVVNVQIDYGKGRTYPALIEMSIVLVRIGIALFVDARLIARQPAHS